MVVRGAVPGLGRPVQIAYAVVDLDVAMHRWASTMGAGPFLVREHIEVRNVRYRGAAATFDHSSAYGQWGDVMVELVCDHTIGESPVRDVVGPGGVGLHHLAFFVDDFDATADALTERGWPEALRAETPGGTVFAFHDATPELGHMIEIYEGSGPLRAFYAMVADAAKNWDGAEPRGPLGSSESRSAPAGEHPE